MTRQLYNGMLCALFMLSSPSVMAAATGLQPHASLWTDYSDNRFLSIEKPSNIVYTTADLGMSVRSDWGVDRLEFLPDLRFSRYSNRPEYNNDIYTAGLNYRHVTQRTRWDVRSSLIHDTTLATAYDASGIVSKKIARHNHRISPLVEWQATSLMSISAGADFGKLTYRGKMDTALVDYRDNTFHVTANYQLGHEEDIQTSMSATDLDVIGSSYHSRDYSFNVGYGKKLTSRLQANFAAGGHRTKVEISRFGAFSSNIRKGWLASAKLTHYLESGTVSFGVKRTVEASVYGGLMQKDQGDLSLGKNFTERLKGEVAGTLFRTKSLAEISADNRDFARVETRIIWRYTQGISISAGYSRLYRKLRESAGAADANLVSLRLNYIGGAKRL